MIVNKENNHNIGALFTVQKWLTDDWIKVLIQMYA